MNEQLARPDPEHAAAILDELCDFSGTPRRDTYTDAEVAKLLTDCGYVCTPGTLAECARKKYIGLPDRDSWDAPHIYSLVAVLQQLERWTPAPCPHDKLKSKARRHVEAMKAAGQVPFADMSATIEILLIRLRDEHVPENRQYLFEAIKLRMAELGFVEE